MNKIIDCGVNLLFALVISFALYLSGTWVFSFGLILSIVTYLCTSTAVGDFVEVAFDKNSIGKVSRRYFNRAFLLSVFSMFLILGYASPIVIGLCSIIIFCL